MGNPRPGQIVDNIFLSVGLLRLAGGQNIQKGSWLVKKGTSENWELSNSAEVAFNGVAQSRGIINTSGDADGANEIECLLPPSYVYATMGGVVQPEGPVEFDSSGQKLVAATTSDISAGRVVGVYIKRAGNSVATACANNVVGVVKLKGAI